MPTANIQGKNVSVEIFVTDDYYPVLCATDMTFTRSPEFITKTGPTSGLFREFQPRIEEWNVTVSGLTKLENEESISFFYLLQTSVRRTVQQIRVVFENNVGDILSISGNAYIGQSSINGPATEFSQASIEFKGTGPFEQSSVIDPPAEQECEVEDTLYLTLAEGASSVHSDLLEQANVVIVGVSRSGLVHSESGGTPGSLEFQTDLPNGDIYFDPTNLGNPGGEQVTVEYKIETP